MSEKTIAELFGEYYEKLLIIQYNSKEKAKATIRLIAEQYASDGIIFDVENGYDINTAIGKQLDILGKYIGIDRFCDGTPLNDDDYRFLLKLKIITNNTTNYAKDIDDLLFQFFGTTVRAIGGNDMSMNFFIEGINNDLALCAIDKGVLPVPMGVKLGNTIIAEKPYFALVPAAQMIYPDTITGFAITSDFDTKEGQFITTNDIA